MKTDTLVNQIVAPAIVGRRSPFAFKQERLPGRDLKILPELMVISTFSPRGCGIASYSEDLIRALEAQFEDSFNVRRVALESDTARHAYAQPTAFVLNTDQADGFVSLAKLINDSDLLAAVLLQYEFGLFPGGGWKLQLFLSSLRKPVLVTLHTVLPKPSTEVRSKIVGIAAVAQQLIVMTQRSAAILQSDYGIPASKITVIPHGTHLAPAIDREALKARHHWQGRQVLATFGLLSAGKGIELSLQALPAIILRHPNVLFLVIGKTHPGVVEVEGERYRLSLEAQVAALGLGDHVAFIDSYLPLPELLEHLQLTDIYLFTSTDPFQAVSGTLSYALSSGCAVVSTPIPHALEIIGKDAGIIIGFGDHVALAEVVCRLLSEADLRAGLSRRGIERMAPTAWENSALAHASLLGNLDARVDLHYRRPPILLDHMRHMTTDRGIVQFAINQQPDLSTGYTLDDNARALIVSCQHYNLTKDPADLPLIQTYLTFIQHCQSADGSFLNYLGELGGFTLQNMEGNLDDANGRAIWALGYMVFAGSHLPADWVATADQLLEAALPIVIEMHSTRAMAFAIKGLYYRNTRGIAFENVALIQQLGNRLHKMYLHESDKDWHWFEGYMTYGNGLLPEAMLCAFLTTGALKFRDVAKESMDFLLEKTFEGEEIRVVRNQTWLHRSDGPPSPATEPSNGAEQPIDIAYTVLGLSRFYETFHTPRYLHMMESAFDWFWGHNHLQQIIYNPTTGGCYDGLEEKSVNLNQGAESTLCYLMARMTIAAAQPLAQRAGTQPMLAQADALARACNC